MATDQHEDDGGIGAGSPFHPPNPAEMCVCNPRIEELKALLRDARGALWELHNWVDRFEFNQDPMVKKINAALGDVLQKSQQL